MPLRRITTVLVFAWCAALAAAPLFGQVRYEVSFPNAVHHEAEFTLFLSNLPAGPVELRMSRSSPGRYALHEFAKNVYAVRATDGAGRRLTIARPNPYQWDVAGHDGSVTVRYTLFADRTDGTYAQVDATHAHLNMPAAFMWARGLGDREIRVTFHPPPGVAWKVATQLHPTDEPMTFSAPDLQYFMDSPTELSAFSLRTWTVEAGDRRDTVRLAVHHLGTEAEVDRFAAMAAQIVTQEIAVFGAPPAWDNNTYRFIADYLPWASGDGMEHRNSTIISSSGALGRNALGLLGTVSHEFFHTWNVERIRPRGLEPFDFERANMSDALWFAEGFTSYYTSLFIRRAGLITDDEYARRLSGGLNTVILAPGRRFFSAAEMSMQAPFVDAATSIDPTSGTNTFISYYTWGSAIGLNLDLTLRGRFNRSLDEFMRVVWQTHGRTEVPYSVGDIEGLLGRFTGDTAFAHAFFARYVRGRDVPDYEALLGQAGLLLRRRNPERGTLGEVRLEFGDAGAALRSASAIRSPLYDAGLDRGDVIHAVDGRVVRSGDDWRDAVTSRRPGSAVELEYTSRAQRRTVRVTVAEDPALEVVTYEAAGMPVSDAARAFRERWLGPRP